MICTLDRRGREREGERERETGSAKEIIIM
jgi:hypothetical protein